MDTTTATRDPALRWFPLLGRPRPTCPALSDRVTEIAQIAHAAAQHADMSQAAHALNKAALIASDSGLPDLARQWCWQHINLYRQLDHLTVLQASHLLEPVVNLARLHIRGRHGHPALQMLEAMHRAVTGNTTLTIDGHTLPTAHLTGPRDQRRALHQWAWLQYLGEGIRIHALAGRWDKALAHATSLNGIGLHLMDGRQTAILAHCLRDERAAARGLLEASTLTQPWEHRVGACLAVLCAEPHPTATQVNAMIDQFLAHKPIPGGAVFHARLGLTVTALASRYDLHRAQHLLRHVITDTITANDAYAARDILTHPTTAQLSHDWQEQLHRIVTAAQLGARALPTPILESLTESVALAERALTVAIGVRYHATPAQL